MLMQYDQLALELVVVVADVTTDLEDVLWDGGFDALLSTSISKALKRISKNFRN